MTNEPVLSLKKQKKETKNVLVFGYGLSILLLFFSWHLSRHHGPVFFILLLIMLAVVMGCITVFRQKLLKAIYTYWMKGAHAIGAFISGCVLCFMYYFVFAPVGIFFRLVKKDHMDRQLDAGALSYWVKRKDDVFDRSQCEKQF